MPQRRISRWSDAYERGTTYRWGMATTHVPQAVGPPAAATRNPVTAALRAVWIFLRTAFRVVLLGETD